MFETDLSKINGDQRRMANRQTVLCWQVIQLLKNNGYFWLEFTEKMLHNHRLFIYLLVLDKTSINYFAQVLRKKANNFAFLTFI